MNRIYSAGMASVLLLLGLAGCGSMSGLGGSAEYGCKAPVGVKCDSVSGTYYNALQNNLPSQRQGRMPSRDSSGAATNTNPTSSREAGAGTLPVSTAAGSASVPGAGDEPAQAAYVATALRSQPRMLRMWIKPWEDADHDLNGESLVWVQIDNGRWLVEHVQHQARQPFMPIRAGRALGAQQTRPTNDASRQAPANTSSADPTSPITQVLRSLENTAHANDN